jgi:regulator of sigma E protease
MNLKSMGGPIAIAHQAGNVIQQGWVPVLFLMAGLSLGLGFFNLLPLPVLDGGMIFIEALEWVSGRSISAKVRQGISVAAFGALLLLLVVLSWGDLMKIPAIAALLS